MIRRRRRLALARWTRSAMAALLGGLALACGAGAPPYAECVDDRDCEEPSMACYRLIFTRTDGEVADGRFCSLGCGSDADCPQSGACVSLEGDDEGRFFCAARCSEAAHCYAGLRCTMVEGAGGTVGLCLP